VGEVGKNYSHLRQIFSWYFMTKTIEIIQSALYLVIISNQNGTYFRDTFIPRLHNEANMKLT